MERLLHGLCDAVVGLDSDSCIIKAAPQLLHLMCPTTPLEPTVLLTTTACSSGIQRLRHSGAKRLSGPLLQDTICLAPPPLLFTMPAELSSRPVSSSPPLLRHPSGRVKMAQMIHVIHLIKDATANEKLVKRFSPQKVGMMQQRQPQTGPQPRQLQLRRSQLTRPQPRHFHLVKEATANGSL